MRDGPPGRTSRSENCETFVSQSTDPTNFVVVWHSLVRMAAARFPAPDAFSTSGSRTIPSHVTQLGLQFQPEMTPLIFASYVYEDVRFSEKEASLERARRLTKALQDLVGEQEARRGVYFGRVGFGPAPKARSVRLPLARLMWQRRADS